MTMRYPAYVMKDGKTRLSEGYFNPIWREIDTRLDTLEGLRVSWQAAVSELQAFGLARINDALEPQYAALADLVAQADQLVAQIPVDVAAALAAALASANDILAQTGDLLALVDEARAAQIDAMTALLAAETGVSLQPYDAETAKLDQDQDWTGRQKFAELAETVYTVSDGVGVTIRASDGTIQIWAPGAARSPTIDIDEGQSVTLMVEAAGVGSIVWPTMSWVGGAQPDLAVSGHTVIVLWRALGTLYGCHAGDAA